jgi:hypothetical protein
MCLIIYKRSLNYFAQHPFLNSLAHSAGGFGIAIILRGFLTGDKILYIGWALFILSVLIHIRSTMK